ncbi:MULTISPECIES: biotin/lipoyl-binding carrier protein [Actinopolyspora]|uniref:Biotin-requiring enzyme n=1 Tax=Actinopolyspora saharensis TaxID=995062 RepID=A0A1H1E618_9ACTN|nr:MULTISPECIES: biotin/lipoyl-binding carrier protein [Actinopolyspora]NHD18604.1 biotin/lipoyl-binding carrier protein [Actinopolyspora sp. BKK2]NHE78074.1 biotin/lipoyl-binding carrier protein [Actinopolyspora sp. BKK1]SDQ84232.1 Biotin-requiring enzyme [Actinopolyspora saharensis]
MAQEIRAEMVANVMSVDVNPGDRVSDGESLVVLESMKMEIPVLLEGSGRVDRVAVQAGDVVREGDLLAVVEGVESS